MADARPPTSAGWQTGEPFGSRRQIGLSRGTRLFIAASFFLAIAGAIIAFFMYMRRPDAARIVTIPISQYSDPPWTTNPWAEEDSDALQAVLPASESSRDKAFGAQETGRLEAQFRKLAESDDSKPIIVHLSALALVDGGDVYVLPANAGPGRKQDWLPIETILSSIQNIRAKHRLLMLDLAHPVAGPFRGILIDDVAERLDDLLSKKAKDDQLPFFVLTSCSKGEFSVPMDEEQLSAFAFYTAAGLRGAADGCGPNGQVDRHVSVRELHDYVRSRVQRWSWNSRRARQTPQLYANTNLADFDLNYRTESRTEPIAKRAYPDWLSKEWSKRDLWIAQNAQAAHTEAYRDAPMAFNSLQAALMRAERAWQAFGRDDQITRIHSALTRDVQNAEAARTRARVNHPAKLRSLNAVTQPSAFPDDWTRLLDSYLIARLAAATTPKDKDPDKVHEKAQKDREEFLKVTKDRRVDASIMLWRRMVGDEAPTRQRIVELSGLLDSTQTAESTESHAARRLAQWRGPRDQGRWAAAAKQYLRTEDAASKAIVSGPVALDWAKDLLSDALRLHVEAERDMFSSDFDRLSASTEKLAQAAVKYESAHWQINRGQNARRAYEDAIVELLWTADRATDDPDFLRIWQDVADVLARVADNLERSPDGKAIASNEWEEATSRLNIARQKLRAPFQSDAVKKSLAAWSTGDAAEYHKLMGLLRSPLAVAKDRTAIWEAARGIAKKLHDQTRDLDTGDDVAHRTPTTLEPTTGRDDSEAQKRNRRVVVALGLLRAAGSDGFAALSAAANAEMDENKWKSLANGLRTTWSDELPKQAAKLLEKKDWFAADRRERFLSSVPAMTSQLPMAAAELRKGDFAAYSAWLEGYYRVMSQLRGSVPAAAAFYDKAAQEIWTGLRD